MDKLSASEPNPHRAFVLVGHGGVPRDYPRDCLLRLRALEAQRRASGAPPSAEETALDDDLRHWPRTSTTDPYQVGLERDAMHLRPRLAPAHLDIRYAWPFAGERLAAFFVEHLRQLDLPKGGA